jgi:hypothetical protein
LSLSNAGKIREQEPTKTILAEKIIIKVLPPVKTKSAEWKSSPYGLLCRLLVEVMNLEITYFEILFSQSFSADSCSHFEAKIAYICFRIGEDQ